MLTNNQIVENIYKSLDIRKMVRKVISESYGCADDDLVQHIYLTLLEMDNSKLNYLFEHNLMGPWIMQIILNNRNYYRSKYQLYFAVKDHELISDNEPDFGIEDLDSKLTKEDKLIFLDQLLSRYSIVSFSAYTVRQKWEFTSLELFKIYINRKHSFNSLGKSMKMSKATVNETLKYAREFIKKEWNRRND